MAASKFPSSLLVYFIVIAVCMQICKGNPKIPLPKLHVPLFIFGDSLFDAGNNNYINTPFQSNFWPYGETFFNFPTGRFSDGRLIPDFIAKYANLPFIHPYLNPTNKNYLHGVNFASAGAGALVETQQGFVIDLKTQLSYFNKVRKVFEEVGGGHEGGAKALLSRAVYLINIGSNDYLAPFLTNSTLFQSHSPQQYVDLVIGNLTTVIKGIYKNGGRKFAFFGVGPLGCFPLVKAVILQGKDECFDEITELAKLHNKHLYKTLLRLGKKLEGFVYTYVDSFTVVIELLNNPAKYGLKEGKVACCGSGPFRGYFSCGGRNGEEYKLCNNPSQHLFFDATHFTDKANQLYAELLWNGNLQTIKPYNLKTLFHV
ncbi:GDSL esterase/lipase 2-like [Cucumis melo var. makuwa]|uniref:GDSL esterase/lipase 2-like n=2 Tax=Cucumis melo TaxID=3656 RepID=A0A5D3D6E4_CUCMM|nr:GDSL esterase/lipase 2-like [Cucumis melo var. makuwa]TYK19137.1 GDSL esterase/lipase 2-like [Cucumis melo var. makuwa]